MELLGKRSVASVLRKVLAVVWWAAVAVLSLAVIFAVVLLVMGPPKGVHPPHFSLHTDYIKVEFVDAAIRNPRALFMVFVPFGAAMACLGLAILTQLRKIFDTLVAGNPFLLENGVRLRKIAYCIFGGVLVQWLAGTVVGRVIAENVTVQGIVFHVKGHLNPGGIFIGLVILILAEIFRQGALLKEDQDLTI